MNMSTQKHQDNLESQLKENSNEEEINYPKFDIEKHGPAVKKHLGLTFLTEIKRGGFGVVYKGLLKDENDVQHDCAIKVLIAKCNTQQGLQEFTKSSIEEIAFLRGQQHPNILQFYRYWLLAHPGETLTSHTIIVTEFLQFSLQQLWEKYDSQPLDWSTVRKVGDDIGNALEHLHLQKIVHHDVKTMNIMANPSQAFKLIDFGLAKSYTGPMHSCLISAGSRGSKFYIPPEMTNSKRSGVTCNPFLADSYAFGMTLSCILVGKEQISTLKCEHDMADLFESTYMKDDADPRIYQLKAIHQLLSPYEPDRRLFIDQFLDRF